MAKQEQPQNMLTDSQDDELHHGERRGKPVCLERSLGVPAAISFLVGTIIGLGIFATPKWVLLYVGSVGMSLVMWALCGMIALFSALCYCESRTQAGSQIRCRILLLVGGVWSPSSIPVLLGVRVVF